MWKETQDILGNMSIGKSWLKVDWGNGYKGFFWRKKQYIIIIILIN